MAKHNPDAKTHQNAAIKDLLIGGTSKSIS